MVMGMVCDWYCDHAIAFEEAEPRAIQKCKTANWWILSQSQQASFFIQWLHICCWIEIRFLHRAQLSAPIYIRVIFFWICKYMYFLLSVCYWAVCIVCCLYFLVSVSMLPVCIHRARGHFHFLLELCSTNCDQHHAISKTALTLGNKSIKCLECRFVFGKSFFFIF